METVMNIFTILGAVASLIFISVFIYMLFEREPVEGCPPCNENCNQGRDCPARK